jgi:Fe-Mn family superoxide dismutase
MSPQGGGKPHGDVASMIDRSFGSYEAFAKAFADAGATQFGSGWAWLVKAGDKLEVRKTPNAETPLTKNVTPLITMDVWEHAYYIDYRNQRPKYISTFLDKLINWNFANANLR